MQLIDLLKLEWKYFTFIGRTTCVAIILSMSTLLSGTIIVHSDGGNIKKLSVECEAGNKGACAELARIAKNDKASEIREAAVIKLTNQDLLADIAKNDENSDVRCAAISQLSEHFLLTQISKINNTRQVRQILTLLAQIAKQDKDQQVHDVALDYLNGYKSQLAPIAKNDKDWKVRSRAVECLTDQNILADIANNDKESRVREAAKRRLQELKKK